jgi:hypothetical protein
MYACVQGVARLGQHAPALEACSQMGTCVQLHVRCHHAALSVCQAPTLGRVLNSAEGPGYTLAQFVDVLILVIDRGGACTKIEVQAKLEEQMASLGSAGDQPGPSRTGSDVLVAMVAANAVALRPVSLLPPRDFPPDVHNYGGAQVDVVTAPSAVAYHCWQLAKPMLEGDLQRRRSNRSRAAEAQQQ